MQLIKDASAEKLRGAYYTPPAIASFILHWGINGGHDADILEPSCGDGVFLECMRNENMLFNTVTAVEYEAAEADKARSLGLHDSEVINQDFHRFCLDTDKQFDLVVGNPPFIRYQYYDAVQQKLADEIFKNAKLKRTKLTNAWVTFVVGCTQLLRDNGKMGFVVPSELLMVKYAQQLRKYLAKTFNKINIISFENLVFEEIQQEVVLLLCEKNDTDEHKIEHIEVKDMEGLLALDPHKLKFPSKDINFHTDKWTYYFLDKKELDLLDKVKNDATISSFANVEVGITTGSNDFFTVPQSVVSMYQLEEYARPMVGRSVQVNSLCFTKRDWKANVASEAKAYLLVFTPDAKENGNEGVKAYLENGETADIHKGYKTRIRNQWWVIPSIKVSDALFLRRNNLYPKFVLNEAGAYTTDTMHRVFIKEDVNKKAFIASYYNSLSFAFAEILGRNFGGGCLELMPSEVGGIYLPYREENEQIFDTLDNMLRKKANADEILDYTDEIILRQGMGFSKEEVKLARSIWHKIINRRLTRETLEKAVEKKKTEKEKQLQLSFIDLFNHYELEPITQNDMVREDIGIEYGKKKCQLPIDLSKNLLICNVKKDNWEQYLDGTAKIYYTGKKFPTTVALNKLYYFMPYLSGKGIRDLFYIKIARLGYRKEGQKDENKKELRLVFEIERIGQLFDDYKKVKLEIWRTFTDTTMERIMELVEQQNINNGSPLL